MGHQHPHPPEGATDGNAAGPGDTVVIDFKGMINGVPFEGGAGQDFSLTLGSHQFIDGFEAQLVGAKAGEERTVNVTFPKEYPGAEVAGKEATFIVNVKEVHAKGSPAAEANEVAQSMEKMMRVHQAAELRKQELGKELEQLAKTRLNPAEEAYSKDKRNYNIALTAGTIAAGAVAAYLTHGMSLLPQLATIGAGTLAGSFITRIPLSGLSKKMEAEAQDIQQLRTQAIGMINQAQQVQALQAQIESHAEQFAQHLTANAPAGPDEPAPQAQPETRFADKVARAPSVSEMASPENAPESHVAAAQASAEAAAAAAKLR